MDHNERAVLDRLREDPAVEMAYQVLTSRLSGSDLTSLLLAVFAARSAAVRPTEVLARYRSDRFTRPATVDGTALSTLQHLACTHTTSEFDEVVLSPLVPFGSHAAIGGVSPNRVVTTVRSLEVAADPTMGLALEAATRRRDLVSPARRNDKVHLLAAQRVVRAQHFDDSRLRAHFALHALVSAGPTQRGPVFETGSFRRHIACYATIVKAVTPDRLIIRISDLSGQSSALGSYCEAIRDLDVPVDVDEHRTAGRSYYTSLAFKLIVQRTDGDIEIGDGGLVDWGAKLLSDNKERMLTSAISLERLAAL